MCPSETDFGLSRTGVASTDSDCSMDFVIIEGSSSTCSLNHNSNRYCGSFLNDFPMAAANTEICGKLNSLNKYLALLIFLLADCTVPFQVNVVTDAGADVIAEKSKGLCLDFVQTPCSGNLFN